MSLVLGIVSRLDIGIDNYHTQYSQSFSLDELSNAPDVRNVQATARALSIESRGLLARHKLLQVLSKVQNDNQSCFTSDGGIVHEQAMFLVGKAATQTLGIVLNMLLDQSSLIGSETVYWDDILGSSLYTGHYILQTTPSRIWRLASDIFSNLKTSCARENLTSLKGIAGNWRPFYRIVQRNVQRGLLEHTKKTLSSFSRCRSNIRQKQQYLKVQKNLHASSIGILLDECLTFASNDQASGKSVMSHREWCRGIYKLVLLIETVLRNLSDPLASAKDFEDGIFYAIDNHFQEKQYQSPEESSVDVADLMQRLTSILQYSIPGNIAYNNSTINKHGRPSIFTRYWFPTTVIFMSLTTSLRILTNRKAEIMRWCSELGSTIIDFWGNWVLQPIQKLVGTIRHDEQSEIAIMSRKSLEADWQSLERMVVDFVSDHGSQESGNSQENIKTITMQVREGDLTPVLKAYERDLRKPFIGTVRGDLVRALLIQIQKTKVDVEVAIGGIDALLKSQELVFGFIGLTPGLLVSYGSARWVASLFDSRKGFRAGLEKQQFRRALRNIDRILSAYLSTPSDNLSYKDYGLCIYEAHALKQRAPYTLPKSALPLFQQDLADVTDLRYGVARQRNAVHRIQWMYSKWI